MFNVNCDRKLQKWSQKVSLQWLAHLSATGKVQLPGTKDLLILCMLDRCDYAFDREQGIHIDMYQIICMTAIHL